MYIGEHARLTPDKPAVIDSATGAMVTFREVDEASTRLARLLRGAGLRRGDHVALLMENNLHYHEVAWAALRSGLYITAINRYLVPDEAAYIVNDSGAKAIVTSAAMRDTADGLAPLIPGCGIRLMMHGAGGGWRSYEEALASVDGGPLEDERLGDTMLYSSGTTGRPKGIKRALRDEHPSAGLRSRDTLARYGFGPDTVYLSPAPLYHSAPLGFTLGAQALGGSVVMMRRFDPLEALAAIERHKVTHSQWVPTMFVRMLKLADAERARHDLSSHRVAIHAAAPCPVDVKRGMIEWWGPILHEYYAGTESNGSTRIDSHDWLRKPGSVGQASLGIIHICDDEGRELPAGEAGLIYFEREEMPFAYHNDDARTDAARHPARPLWSTLGDVGYLDDEGYLFLTDRKAFMIIAGGVNIYPQEIEDALVLHPKVGDVAVFGVPNEDLGEEVKAVVEPAPGIAPSPALAEELLEFARGRLSRQKVPRSIDFTDAMPRLPTGKLYKRLLRDAYWPKKA